MKKQPNSKNEESKVAASMSNDSSIQDVDDFYVYIYDEEDNSS